MNVRAKRGYAIRAMSARETGIAIDLAAAEGWNPGLHDAGNFHVADPDGFLVGELDGEPIATISAVRYGKAFGFIGLYIVKPEFRGKGYGMAIWNAGLDRLAGRNVGLDGVVAQQDNYRKSGFALAYRNIRFAGTASDGSLDPGIVDASRVAPGAIVRYDAPLFPDERTAFLAAWIAQPDAIALCALDRGELRGYGVIRRGRSGWKIGPLDADSPAIADALFRALGSSVPAGDGVFLDIPEPNAHALALVERHGMRRVFETARMYTGDFPPLPLERIYGVTTFELG